MIVNGAGQERRVPEKDIENSTLGDIIRGLIADHFLTKEEALRFLRELNRV